jgi:hypothetical protein
MSAFWSVLKREADERRLLILGALILGMIPFAITLLSSPTGRNLTAERIQIAAILAAVTTTITALFLGATVIARDLAERRLSFYFTRPISNWAIWGGKMAAAAALSLIAGALILLPAVLTGLREMTELTEPRTALLVLVVGVALLGILGLAHAFGVLLRTRSPWLLLDLGGALFLPWIVMQARAPLVQAGIPEVGGSRPSILTGGYLALAIFLVVAALGAGALQVASGRTDPRRGHKLFSLTFWSAALAAALSFSLFSRWVIDVDPKDFRKLEAVVAAPAGPWVLASGEVHRRPGFFPLFLLDTSSRRSVRIDAGAHFIETSAGRSLRIAGGYLLSSFTPFSDDGSHALWLEPQEGGGFRVMQLDLTRPGSQPASTPLAFDFAPLLAAVSPDGSRLATVADGGRRLLVQDLRQGSILALENLPAYGGKLEFDGPDRVLLQQIHSTKGCLSLEIDLRSRTSNQQSCHERSISRGIPGDLFPVSPIWESFVVKVGDRLVWDAVSGSGTHLLIQKYGEAPEGPKHRVPFPGAHRLSPGGQISARHLAVQVNRKERSTASSQIYTVDLDTGEKRLLGTGLGVIEGSRGAIPGSPATRLFYNERNLVHIDPATGRRTVVLRVS